MLRKTSAKSEDNESLEEKFSLDRSPRSPRLRNLSDARNEAKVSK
jgi:hypothetical protein